MEGTIVTGKAGCPAGPEEKVGEADTRNLEEHISGKLGTSDRARGRGVFTSQVLERHPVLGTATPGLGDRRDCPQKPQQGQA